MSQTFKCILLMYMMRKPENCEAAKSWVVTWSLIEATNTSIKQKFPKTWEFIYEAASLKSFANVVIIFCQELIQSWKHIGKGFTEALYKCCCKLLSGTNSIVGNILLIANSKLATNCGFLQIAKLLDLPPCIWPHQHPPAGSLFRI